MQHCPSFINDKYQGLEPGGDFIFQSTRLFEVQCDLIMPKNYLPILSLKILSTTQLHKHTIKHKQSIGDSHYPCCILVTGHK